MVIIKLFVPKMRCLFHRGRRLFQSWTLVFTRMYDITYLLLTEVEVRTVS